MQQRTAEVEARNVAMINQVSPDKSIIGVAMDKTIVDTMRDFIRNWLGFVIIVIIIFSLFNVSAHYEIDWPVFLKYVAVSGLLFATAIIVYKFAFGVSANSWAHGGFVVFAFLFSAVPAQMLLFPGMSPNEVRTAFIVPSCSLVVSDIIKFVGNNYYHEYKDGGIYPYDYKTLKKDEKTGAVNCNVGIAIRDQGDVGRLIFKVEKDVDLSDIRLRNVEFHQTR
jgi:hypothetical protein